ncbi:branched-chain amino acid ABC transporter permease [Candidatus Halobonum tyrrellensis]|uniref:branched-chain amino acid ABC transporter permease n=1 Tax=Candidatus Halobonum tyrrellensis TaxID=1431545 RepID=UPI000677D825
MLSSVVDRVQRRTRLGKHGWAVLGVAFGVVLLLDLVRRLLSGDLTVALLVGYLWNGLTYGLVIGLAGVGLSLTYDLLEFANFAHGDYITVSAFVGWGAAYLIAGFGRFDPGSLFFLGVGGTLYPGDVGVSVTTAPVAILGGLVVAAAAGAVVAVTLDRVVYRSMRGMDAISLLIASIGVAFVLRYLTIYVFTQQAFGLTVSAWTYGVALPGGTVNVSAPTLLLVASSLAAMAGVHLLLTRTKLGKAMRAMAANRSLARVTGIPSERVILATWLIGGALAGLAGFMIALLQGTITYQIGWTLLLLVFAGVIMGGIGSVYGAIVGGVLIGLITRVSLVWIPASFTEAMGFLIMILILLTRPQGLFGGETA